MRMDAILLSMETPVIIGYRGKAIATKCVHCQSEIMAKVKVRNVLTWSCPKCGGFNRTERQEVK